MKNYCKFKETNCKTAKTLSRLRNKPVLNAIEKQLLQVCITTCANCDGPRERKERERGDRER